MRGGRLGVVPHDVADHDHRCAVALEEGVVPVAAHPGGLGRRDVADDDGAVPQLGRIGEQAALQRLGELGLTALPVHPCDRPGGVRGDLSGGLDVLGRHVRPASWYSVRTPTVRSSAVSGSTVADDGPSSRSRSRAGPGDISASTVLIDSVTGVPAPSARATGEAIGQRVQAHAGVVLQQRAPGGIDVPAADVADVALAVDDGDDAAVGEDGDHQPREPGERGLGVPRDGQLRAHLGEQRGVLHRPGRRVLGPAAVGDVEQVEREAPGPGQARTSNQPRSASGWAASKVTGSPDATAER